MMSIFQRSAALGLRTETGRRRQKELSRSCTYDGKTMTGELPLTKYSFPTCKTRGDFESLQATLGEIMKKEYGTAEHWSVTLSIGGRLNPTYLASCTSSGKWFDLQPADREQYDEEECLSLADFHQQRLYRRESFSAPASGRAFSLQPRNRDWLTPFLS